MRRVLLARAAETLPAAQAALEAEGFSVCPAPVLTLAPRLETDSDRALALALDRFDAVVVISEAAARGALLRFERFWPQWPLHPQWFAVGARSAEPLRAEGLPVTVPEPPTTEGLLTLPALRSAQETLILKGEGGRPDLEAGLRTLGQRVETLALYARVVQPCELPSAAAVDVVVVGSGACLDALLASGGARFRAHPLLAPSARVAALAQAAGFSNARPLASLAPVALVDALRRLSLDGGAGDNVQSASSGELP
ncbi:MAG: uroporphyrinogen-III synthase [Pseudomonadales bacterium]|nr:uroporphyrinogen-III synthase [Pseudomonadales bacterium]MBL6807755.1 uroporphyrinogen-III synthase [Pseudomonadales bacterium]